MDLADEKQIKKRKCKTKEDQPTKGLETLRQEISIDILSRLPITYLLQSKVVCRAWNMLSHDLHLVNLHLARAIRNNSCLIFHSDYPIRNQLYFVELSDLDDTENVRKIQAPFSASMPEFDVVGSCNGLLCLFDSLFCDAIHIYNPFTRDLKELPKSFHFKEQEVIFGFGFHPATNEYKVIKIVYYNNAYDEYNRPWHYPKFRPRGFRFSDVQILSLCSNTWRSIGKVPYKLDRRWLSEASVNGRLHWNGRILLEHRGGNLVSYDPESGTFEDLMFQGMPNVVQTVVHVGSLNIPTDT
ncbi:unnamed protein product [Ilex paraguariensis]|uniref:F-box domain-containing protein n=1 Tax=Ilex paraguariensis TaxID=185542 RepID=A0ABC8QLG1_9AQUA